MYNNKRQSIFAWCNSDTKGPFNGFKKVALTFRGNDVVAIDPKGTKHPLYQRERFRTGETVFKKVTRFETEQVFAV